MPQIRFTPRQGSMGGTLSEIPPFPKQRFGLNVPEAIGDAARTVWQNLIRPEWKEQENGVWQSIGQLKAELSYTAAFTPKEDVLDIRIRLTNQSSRTWKQSLAFNCFNCGSSPWIRDYECVRHWVRTKGEFKRLVETPRRFGPRPTVQLYSVEGAPPGAEIPFVDRFKATPDVVLEGWFAIHARDGKRLVAVVSKPALFLFQNMEYSCIHSSPGFGALEPGESGEALTRIYFVEASLQEWYERMKADLA